MFSTLEKIKDLAKNRGISLAKLEESLGYSTNYFYTLKTKAPNSERLQEIADYFNVSTDYLLGRTDNPNIANSSSDNFSAGGRAIARKYDNASPEEKKYFDKIIAAMFEDDEEDD